MNKRLLLLLLLVPLLLIQAKPVYGQVTKPDLYLPLNIYQPVKVAFNFVFTTNLTVTCDTVGASYWFTQTSPTSVTFTANTTDVYTLTITIGYTEPVEQTMVLGIWSANVLIVDSMPIDMEGKSFTLMLKISTTPAPQYPSTEDIVDVLLERVQEVITALILGMEEQQRTNTAKLDQAVTYSQFAAGLSAINTVIVIIIMFYLLKRRREAG